ncbi:MAG: hypothetical protein EBR72_10215, partial [Bacteroidetes bacterium]|nr:hypothetical protein [Bacteroidota bacterium]
YTVCFFRLISLTQSSIHQTFEIDPASLEKYSPKNQTSHLKDFMLRPIKNRVDQNMTLGLLW